MDPSFREIKNNGFLKWTNEQKLTILVVYEQLFRTHCSKISFFSKNQRFFSEKNFSEKTNEIYGKWTVIIENERNQLYFERLIGRSWTMNGQNEKSWTCPALI